MELDADAVTADIADDTVTVLFRQIVDSLPHVAQIAPRLDLLQTRLDASSVTSTSFFFSGVVSPMMNMREESE